MITTHSKEALRSLLAERRAANAPETHGLTRPTGQGRRARGLSQHQVDHLLDRSLGTCQRLESGKYTNPPYELLYDISRLLGLNEHEWIALHRYALAQNPPGPLNSDSGYRVSGAWQETVNGIQHMAYLTDASWNLLVSNPACAGLFADRQVPRNTLRWMLLSPEARNTLTDWETAWAPLVLPQLRAALATRRDETLHNIEADVLADPTTRSLYETNGVYVHPDGDQRPLHHAILGPGWVTMCSAQPEGSPGARLMILLFQPGRRHPPRKSLTALHSRDH